jgi:hypothetical protein
MSKGINLLIAGGLVWFTINYFVYYSAYEWMVADTTGSEYIAQNITHARQVKCVGEVQRPQWGCESCTYTDTVSGPFYICNPCNQTTPLLGYDGMYNITDLDMEVFIHQAKNIYYNDSPVLQLFRCMHQSSWWCHNLVEWILETSYRSGSIEFRLSVAIYMLIKLYNLFIASLYVVLLANQIAQDKKKEKERIEKQRKERESDDASIDIKKSLKPDTKKSRYQVQNESSSSESENDEPAPHEPPQKSRSREKHRDSHSYSSSKSRSSRSKSPSVPRSPVKVKTNPVSELDLFGSSFSSDPKV